MALREILAAFGIEFDSKELVKGNKLVDGMVDKLNDVGKVVAGAFALDAVIGFGRELISQAAGLDDLSVALGVSTQEIQELGYAAQLSGADADTLQAALSRLSKGAAEVAETAKGPVADALKKLNVEVKNQDGTLRTSADLFQDIAGGIAAIENPTEKAGVAAALFGKQYTKLLPLLNEGEEGIRKLREEAGELGFVFSKDFVDSAKEVDDNLDRLSLGFRGLAVQALGPILPGLLELTTGATRWIRTVVTWVRETKVVTTALTVLTGRGILGLLGAGGRMLNAVGGWRGAFMALRGILLRVLVPFLALEDLIVFLAGGKSVIGELLDTAFGSGAQEKVRALIVDGVVKSWNELGDALTQAKGFLDENAGVIGTLLAAYGLYKAAVIGLTGAKLTYTGVVAGLTAVKATYFAVVKAGTLVLGLFRGATLASTAANVAAQASLLPVIATVAAATAAIGALVAAWDQWNKLDKETEGLGFDGIVKEMWNQGTFNPFEAVDNFQNEEARKRAGLGTQNGVMVRGTDAALGGGDPNAVRVPFAGPTASVPIPLGAGATVTTTLAPNVEQHFHMPQGAPLDQARKVGEAAARGVARGTDLAATEAAVVRTAG